MNPLPGIRENIGAAAGYLVNKLDDARIGVDRLKRKASASARGLGASTASAARRVGASVLGLPGTLRGSVSGIYKRFTTDPRFKQDKLVHANMETKDADEGAGLQNFRYTESGEIFDSHHSKVGQFYQHADGKYHPYFLPNRYDPTKSWTMSKMNPLSTHRY